MRERLVECVAVVESLADGDWVEVGDTLCVSVAVSELVGVVVKVGEGEVEAVPVCVSVVDGVSVSVKVDVSVWERVSVTVHDSELV